MTDDWQQHTEMLSQGFARSFAVRDCVALLMADLARRSGDADGYFHKAAEALQARLDELPEGISDLKERVRVEPDWIVGCAQAFHRLGQP